MSSAIIAGSRSITDYEFVVACIKRSGFNITEVISGKAPDGVDALGERYAKENNIPVKPFPADWKNIHRPGAVIRTNRFGKKYDAAAGHIRNEEMARYAASRKGCCIVIHDGVSPGSKDMRELAQKYVLSLYYVKSRPTLSDEEHDKQMSLLKRGNR